MTKSNHQKNQKIVLGVGGGIAAYKACELARLFVKSGYSVNVVMTTAATKFVAPLTFQALTETPVFTDLFDLDQESKMGHIRLADEACAVVVAPATADLMAKAAHGFADQLLTTILLATKAPIFWSPSMNVNMWENPLTQNNLKTLKSLGHHVIDPEVGELACGWNGAGRLAEPQTIFEAVLSKIQANRV